MILSTRFIFIFALTLISLLSYQACVHDPIQVIDDDPKSADTTKTDTTKTDSSLMHPQCDTSKIYFYKDILPIFTKSCAIAGCHDPRTATDGYVLNNFENIKKKGLVSGKPASSKIYNVISDSRSRDIMPPKPYTPLTADQVSKINRWITEGLKNDSCSLNVVCDTINVSYTKHLIPLFSESCVPCHGNITSYAGIKLNTYIGVKNAINEGRFFGAIKWQNGYSKMPPDQDKLTNCKIIQLEKWVLAGMPNN